MHHLYQTIAPLDVIPQFFFFFFTSALRAYHSINCHLIDASQSLFVVGSQAQGAYSPVSKLFMSSTLSSKSKMFAFSSIRDLVTDFGRVTKPFQMSVRLR